MASIVGGGSMESLTQTAGVSRAFAGWVALPCGQSAHGQGPPPVLAIDPKVQHLGIPALGVRTQLVRYLLGTAWPSARGAFMSIQGGMW